MVLCPFLLICFLLSGIEKELLIPHRKQLSGHDQKPLHYKFWYPHTGR